MPDRSECPACESPNWADASLKRDLVRLRQVVSTSFDRNSRSHDDKDEREPAFYNRHESVVIPEDAERQAYQIRGGTVPFGFEFLGKLTLRVVNLGQDSPEIHAFRLGGREVSSGGFVLCPDCGKVQSRKSASGEEELKHDLSCRHRGKDAAPQKAVFLYRELNSEAIRVLLLRPTSCWPTHYHCPSVWPASACLNSPISNTMSPWRASLSHCPRANGDISLTQSSRAGSWPWRIFLEITTTRDSRARAGSPALMSLEIRKISLDGR